MLCVKMEGEEEEEGQAAKILLNVGPGEWDENKPHICTVFIGRWYMVEQRQRDKCLLRYFD